MPGFARRRWWMLSPETQFKKEFEALRTQLAAQAAELARAKGQIQVVIDWAAATKDTPDEALPLEIEMLAEELQAFLHAAIPPPGSQEGELDPKGVRNG